MQKLRVFVALVVLLVSVVVMTSSVLADARINVVDHFGGDVLYCNHTDGCIVTNSQGVTLASAAQSDIDSAVQAACDSGIAQHIEMGEGTYGALALVVTCPNALTLVGYDEWGKQHSMSFTTAYLPVNAPGASEMDIFCSVDLAGHGFSSVDGIHINDGFDIWVSNETYSLVSFDHWSTTSEGYPSCFGF